VQNLRRESERPSEYQGKHCSWMDMKKWLLFYPLENELSCYSLKTKEKRGKANLYF